MVPLFIKTCVLGSDHEAMQDKFKHWSRSLYEKRWHEVHRFVRELQHLLPAFRATWSEGRLAAGIDAGGGGAQRDASRFDPAMMTRSLHCPVFDITIRVVLLVEELPQLGQKGALAMPPCSPHLQSTMRSRYSTGSTLAFLRTTERGTPHAPWQACDFRSSLAARSMNSVLR